MNEYIERIVEIVSLISVVALIIFVLLYAVLSKPNKKQKKTYGGSIIANGNGLIMNGTQNRNNGIPIEELYESISECGIQLNYLKVKKQDTTD